jgi:hypothetical protein
VNLSALAAFPDSSLTLFPGPLRGANGGGPLEIYSAKGEARGKRPRSPDTKYGREERAIRFHGPRLSSQPVLQNGLVQLMGDPDTGSVWRTGNA